MKVTFEFGGLKFQSELAGGISLAIAMDFEGAQPNHFGAPRANKAALKLGGFVGDTEKGGSCNVDALEFIPHCNGTHTETVGHIVNEDVYVGHNSHILMTAILLSVEQEPCEAAKKRGESYRPPLDLEKDQIISRGQLEFAFQKLAERTGIGAIDNQASEAVILRTQWDVSIKSATYGQDVEPAFLTVDAMQLLVEKGYRHLLLDLPSVDRMYDDGLLTNHHLFWKVKEGTHELDGETEQDKTITEMIFVPDEVEDGLYVLNLQVPELCTDAAPSRPVIFKTKQVEV